MRIEGHWAGVFPVVALCVSCTCTATNIERSGVPGPSADASVGNGRDGQSPSAEAASCRSDSAKRLVCDTSMLSGLPPGPAVVVQERPFPAPKPAGGVIAPGDYVLVAETKYGNSAPDTMAPRAGDVVRRFAHVDCDVMNETDEHGSQVDCHRLVPHGHSVLEISGWSGPGIPDSRDEASYTASGSRLTVMHLYPYGDGDPFTVLGAYAVVDEFVAISAGPAAASPIVDAGTPATPKGRDPRCPPMPPLTGDPCSPDPAPLECEYGGDAWHRCTALARCALDLDGAFHFRITQPEQCTPLNPPECPPNYEAATALVAKLADGGAPYAFVDGGVGSGSVSESTTCNYPEGICGCGWAPVGDPCPWMCRSGQTLPDGGIDVRCPALRPLAGDPCLPGLECDYRSVGCTPAISLGPSMICQGGYWAHVGVLFLGCGPLP